MKRRKDLSMWVFAVCAGMLFAIAPHVQGDDDDGGRISLEGSWLVTSPLGIRGVETMTPLDSSGRRVSVRLTTLSADATALGCCPEAEYLSVGIGEAAMTGRSTFEANLLSYSMRAPTQAECDGDVIERERCP